MTDGPRYVHLSDHYAVDEATLCMHIPPSPNADFRCIATKGHSGKHQHAWSPESSFKDQVVGVHYAQAKPTPRPTEKATLRRALDDQQENFSSEPVMLRPETLRAAIAALEQSDAVLWQDIETAPTDGTPVLLFDPDVPEVTVGSYDSNEERWGDDRARGFPINPPCWQPLPEPPSQAAPTSPRESTHDSP